MKYKRQTNELPQRPGAFEMLEFHDSNMTSVTMYVQRTDPRVATKGEAKHDGCQEGSRKCLPFRSAPPVFSGIRVTRYLVLCVCFVDRCLSFFIWSLCYLVLGANIRILPSNIRIYPHISVFSPVFNFRYLRSVLKYYMSKCKER